MPTEFEDVITALASVAAMLLSRTGAGRAEAVDRSCDSLLRHLARELEDVCPRNVSKRAREKAAQLGLGDLRRFHWDDRKKRVLRGHAQLFHWEHYWPVSDQVRDLRALCAPQENAIAAILRRTRIAWVLAEENARLQRCRRSDPARSYAEAGIELAHPWEEPGALDARHFHRVVAT